MVVALGIALIGSLAPAQASAREFYVAVSGAATNDGSISRPLDLATALSATSPARPGDTIWVRGGVYRGTYVSYLTGTSAAPIVVRQYQGERVTIDTNPSQKDGILARGAYTWFWGIEIMNSNPSRYSSQTGSWPTDVPRGYGVTARGRGLKFINMIVHDMANGFGMWIEAVDSEVYGSIVYYNGWQAPDRAHGHGIYAQNQSGRMRLTDNVIFHQFSHGLHAYGSDAAFLDYITMDGNVAFNNGIVSADGLARELLMGGGDVAASPEVMNNTTYGAQVNLGYGAGCTNMQATGNYFSATSVRVVNCAGNISGNTMHSIYGLSNLPTQYTNNTFLTTPTGVVVRVRPNRYEPGRAHVAVYNWQNATQVALNLSAAGLAVGQSFEIRDAQNYFGSVPLYSGVYSGAAVTVPLKGLPVVSTVGTVPRSPTHSDQFAAFIVVPTSAPSDETPTASLTASPLTIASGGSATLTWNTTGATTITIDPLGAVPASGSRTVSPTATTTYTLTAVSASGATVTRTQTVTVTASTPPPNAPPTVSITSPANGASLLASSKVIVTATAADSDGTVSIVRFYRNGGYGGSDSGAPYDLAWTLVPGSYTLYATATDNSGAVTRSASVTFTVFDPAAGNVPPTVTLTSPADGATLVAPATISAAATAADADGSVSLVRFYRNGVFAGSDSTPPYSLSWTDLAAGSYSVEAEAVDNDGAVKRSAAASVTVTAPSTPPPSDPGPIGYIISPSNGAIIAVGSTRLIEGIVTDHNSGVARVEFYDGATRLGTVTRAPFTLSWTPTVVGTHVLTLKMTNNNGTTKVSSPTTVTVR